MIPKRNFIFLNEGGLNLNNGVHRFKLHRHLVEGAVKTVWVKQVFCLLFGLDTFHCIRNVSDSIQNLINQPCLGKKFELVNTKSEHLRNSEEQFFVITFGLIEWESMLVFSYCLYRYYHRRSSYQERVGWDPSKQFNSVSFCLSKVRTWFSHIIYVMVFSVCN